MSALAFEISAAAAVVLASAVLVSRRSLRSGLVLLGLYSVQAACLIWASRTIDAVSWSSWSRVMFLAVLVAVLSHLSLIHI